MNNIRKSMIGLAAITWLLAACGQNNTTTENTPAGNATPAVSNGQHLFINNCVQCHSIKQDKLGPKLEGVLARWDNDTTRLIAFVKNSQQVIADGKDARANKVFHDWSQAQMTAFPNLTDGEIKEILDYIGKGVE